MLKDRLLKYLKHKSISQGKFEKLAELSTGFVNNIGAGINSKSRLKIEKAFPELNVEWLLTGQGDMLKNEDDLVSLPVNNNKDLELIELRAINDVLIDYVLRIRAELRKQPLTTVVDEFEQDLTLQLRKLKK